MFQYAIYDEGKLPNPITIIEPIPWYLDLEKWVQKYLSFLDNLCKSFFSNYHFLAMPLFEWNIMSTCQYMIRLSFKPLVNFSDAKPFIIEILITEFLTFLIRSYVFIKVIHRVWHKIVPFYSSRNVAFFHVYSVQSFFMPVFGSTNIFQSPPFENSFHVTHFLKEMPNPTFFGKNNKW